MKTFLTIILVLFTSAALAQPVEEWVARYNGPGNYYDNARALAVDASRYVYVTGYSGGSGTSYDYTTIKYNSEGNQLWLARYNGPGSHWDRAYAMALDPFGNVYVTGGSYGSGTRPDYATIKYDSNGNELWVARYNGPGNNWDEAYAMALDPSGNVYVTGYSEDSDTSYRDYATIKYDSQGNQLWVARYDGPREYWDEAYALALDPSGNVYVTGFSFGAGADWDYATIKYDPEGNQLWVARYNGPGNYRDWAYALALDPSGNVYVTGLSYGSGTRFDYATIKYDSEGNQLWVARYNGPGNEFDQAYALALDPTGNVYVTGYSTGSGTSADYATIKYDSEGNQLWVARYNGPGNDWDWAYALALDPSGNVYVTGRSIGSGTYEDYATIKYDPEGNQLWVARYNGPGNDWDVATALALDPSGNVYVTGESYGSGTYNDYATIKYSQWMPVEITCEALTPIFCRGKNFYFKLSVTNNTEGDVSGTVTFSGYSGYDCDPANILVTIPRARTYPPGLTETYYSFNVPRWLAPSQYSASVGGTLSGYEVFCCMNTDIVQCSRWRMGDNTGWELVEVTRPEVPVSKVTSLARNYPNPFNAATEISYTLADAGDVTLAICNLRGQLIETLVNGYQEAGAYEVIWDASGQASGIYFCKLTAGDFTEVRRMTLLK